MKRIIENAKAALYTRVSTSYQVDKDSLPHQREELINYSQYALGINQYEVFEDAGFSGKNTDRPAFQDMMRRIRQGEFTHLIVNKIDRISRNLLDFAAMYDELKELGVVFVSRNEQFDTSNAMGEAMLKIILVFAELERHVTSERVTAIMIDRAQKGKWNGANVPLGYKWSEEKKFPVIDEVESKIVKKIFDMYTSGESMLAISIFLNNNNIQTKRNGKWTTATVRQILVNPFYKGTLRYNYRSSARGKIKKESEWIVLDNNHQGIISSEQWEEVQKITVSRRSGKGLERKKYDHIFIGLISCICGSHASVHIQYNKKVPIYSRYFCVRSHVSGRGECDNNSSVSDIMIGEFLFSYLQNMIYVQDNLDKINSLEKLEKELLYGKYLDKVSYIEENSLQDIYNNFMQKSNVRYQQKEVVQLDVEMDKEQPLLNEQQSHQKALKRLNKAYLYGDGSLSEREFLTERQNIQENIRKTELEIKKLHQSKNVNSDDVKFLQETSDFLIRHTIAKRGTINWREFAANINNRDVNRFLKTIINKIAFYHKKIMYIEFKNGIKHKFVYK